MNITLDQARAFAAIVDQGTIQGAARYLNKGHSAIMYLLKSLEEQTGLELFDRSGYRNQITPRGDVVLKYCRQLILTTTEMERVCQKLQSDWEPSLKLVYDGVIDFNLIADALNRLNESQVPTELKVLAAYLHEVEARFEDEDADIMVTILPIKQKHIASVRLKPIRMLLVAHKTHKLARLRKKVDDSRLQDHTYINIRSASNSLGFSTDEVEFSSSFSVNDFSTKKQAIGRGLGYGWLPEYLIERELREKSLRVLNTEMENEHTLKPRLYHRKDELIGRAAKQLLRYFKQF